MLKRREIVMIIILMVMIAGVGYYMFYLMHTLSRFQTVLTAIGTKSQEVENAKLRIIQNETLTQRWNELREELADYLETLPESFDDADILIRIQRIIYPHTKDISVTFPSKGIDNTATTIYPVSIGFNVPYTALQKILADFAAEGVDNRIIDISCIRVEDEENNAVLLRVLMQVEFLVQYQTEGSDAS